MTKAEERRVRQSLDRARVKLKERQLELTDAERALMRERAAVWAERGEAVALLRLLCERYTGRVAWPDETPLQEIIERHLIGPLEPLLERGAPTPAQAPPPLPPRPAPRPLRPTAVPEIVHKIMVVPAQDRTRMGHAARCTCGWVSAVMAGEAMAMVAAEQHAQRMAEVRRA